MMMIKAKDLNISHRRETSKNNNSTICFTSERKTKGSGIGQWMIWLAKFEFWRGMETRQRDFAITSSAFVAEGIFIGDRIFRHKPFMGKIKKKKKKKKEAKPQRQKDDKIRKGKKAVKKEETQPINQPTTQTNKENYNEHTLKFIKTPFSCLQRRVVSSSLSKRVCRESTSTKEPVNKPRKNTISTTKSLQKERILMHSCNWVFSYNRVIEVKRNAQHLTQKRKKKRKKERKKRSG